MSRGIFLLAGNLKAAPIVVVSCASGWRRLTGECMAPHALFPLRYLKKKSIPGSCPPLPASRYQLATVGTRIVYHDCHIFVDYNYYSVPFEYVGREVEIELGENSLKVYHQGKQIALHPRLSGRGKFSTIQSHYPKDKRYAETEYQEKYQTKMARIGPFAEQLFFLMVAENASYWAKPVKGILSLLKKYSPQVVDLACKRALAYGAYHYQTVKKICEKGTYVLPVEFSADQEE